MAAVGGQSNDGGARPRLFPHRLGVDAALPAPFGVGDGGYLGGFDFAAAAPEDVGVGDGDGDRDEIVPFELGHRLFAAANQPKRFFRAAGAHHNDVFAAPGLIDAIAEFAHAVIADASSGR